MSQVPPPSQPSTAGSNKNLYTILAWALFPPIGSLIMLFVGKDDPDVKWNAAEATVIHGAALALYIVLWIVGAVTVVLSIVAILWGLVWFVMWLVGLILAVQAHGGRVNYPVVGQMAQNYVPTVEAWAK